MYRCHNDLPLSWPADVYYNLWEQSCCWKRSSERSLLAAILSMLSDETPPHLILRHTLAASRDQIMVQFMEDSIVLDNSILLCLDFG